MIRNGRVPIPNKFSRKERRFVSEWVQCLLPNPRRSLDLEERLPSFASIGNRAGFPAGSRQTEESYGNGQIRGTRRDAAPRGNTQWVRVDAVGIDVFAELQSVHQRIGPLPPMAAGRRCRRMQFPGRANGAGSRRTKRPLSRPAQFFQPSVVDTMWAEPEGNK